MNIGFISTWFERGASYVTKSYIEALEHNHNIYVYARGGEKFAKGDKEWDKDYVTWGKRLSGTNINKKHLYKWLKKNEIDVLFFNEQHELSIVARLKKDFKNLKVGSYVDYYKENTIELFDMFDYIICNTKKHYNTFENHKQKYFIPWGTDVDLFKPIKDSPINDKLVFFHSAGMSNRKGTDLVIKAFINGELFNNSKLVIHTQVDINEYTEYSNDYLEKYNIEVINKTVTAPGLYHLGDVYVYPTKLEGLGLTIFEALSCGLPVIITNNSPMNEIVNDDVGKLVKVEKFYARSDGYYWPLSVCNVSDLIEKMRFYIDNFNDIKEIKLRSRMYAVEKLNWKNQCGKVNEIFEKSVIMDLDEDLYNKIIRKEKNERINHLKSSFNSNYFIGHFFKSMMDKIRKT